MMMHQAAMSKQRSSWKVTHVSDCPKDCMDSFNKALASWVAWWEPIDTFKVTIIVSTHACNISVENLIAVHNGKLCFTWFVNLDNLILLNWCWISNSKPLVLIWIHDMSMEWLALILGNVRLLDTLGSRELYCEIAQF